MILPLGTKECVSIRVHGEQWSGIPIKVYFHFTPSVPGIHSGSTVALMRIKRLLRVNELFYFSYSFMDKKTLHKVTKLPLMLSTSILDLKKLSKLKEVYKFAILKAIHFSTLMV